jgi:arsenate reductase
MKVAKQQKPLNVLFLCTGNAARSIMAEAILNRLGRGRFKAFSAGSEPAGYVHPLALQMLRNAHFDVSNARSKPWDEFAQPDAPNLDFVFTVCDNAAKEVCPVWPGQPMTAHWGLPDPAKAEGTDAEKAVAVLGTWAAHVMFDENVLQLSTKARAGSGLWFAEALATFGLILTILGTQRWKVDIVPVTVGLYIASAYWFTASTSFANPAVTLARSITNTFAGIQPSHAPAFVVAQLVGALAGTLFCWFLFAQMRQA